MRLPNHASLFRMNQSIEECCRICTMAEGYYELGLFEEAFKLVESLPHDLKVGAQSTLLRLQSTPCATGCPDVFSFA